MLKCIITLYEEAQKAIADSPPEKRVTWAYIKTTLAHILEKVRTFDLFCVCCGDAVEDSTFSPPDCLVLTVSTRASASHESHHQQVKDTKFVDPKKPAAELRAHYDVIVKEIEEAFAAIVDV